MGYIASWMANLSSTVQDQMDSSTRRFGWFMRIRKARFGLAPGGD